MPRQSANTTAARAPGRAGRGYGWAVLGILVIAAVWRVGFARAMPCLARDSVTFCWYARDLGEGGLAYLRASTTHQHPLFPTLVLGAQRVARLLGAPDSPLTWQRSGQAVSGIAGLAAVALAGALSVRFVRRLQLPVDERLAGCCGLLLAALLPLNVWLSAEVMSDQLHLALYLVGALALLKLDSFRAAAVCGLAGGLAFVTRPEGIVVALAGLVALVLDGAGRRQVRVARGLVLCCAFLVCALPFWMAVGKLSSKKNPLDWLRKSDAALHAPDSQVPIASGLRVPHAGVLPAASPDSEVRRHSFAAGGFGGCGRRPLLLARLELLELPWYMLVPWTLYALFRAGRVVVPLWALFPLIALHRRLLRPPLVGLSACMAGHFGLTVLLLHRYHYLHPRHLLVVIMLLLPFAATGLAWVIGWARGRGWKGWWAAAGAAIGLSALTLMSYALRQPSYADRFFPAAARWLAARDPEIASKRIMCGSSQRRVVFYADARWVWWSDAPGEYWALREQVLAQRPDYFVLETGPGFERPGFERQGNEQIAEQLRADPQLADCRGQEVSYAIPKDGLLVFFAFEWE